MPASEVAELALIEDGGKLDVDGSGRLPVLAELPAGFAGLEAGVAVPTESLDGYEVFFWASSGSSIPAFADYPYNVSINFSVSRVEPGARANIEQSYKDHATVKVGDSTAWVGENITKDCGEAPEDGHNPTVLIWFRGNVGMTLQMYPIPECEPGALSLAQAIEVAELVADCSGFNTGTPECRMAPGTGPP